MKAGELIVDAAPYAVVAAGIAGGVYFDAPYLTVTAGIVGGAYLDRSAVNHAGSTESAISEKMQRATAKTEVDAKNKNKLTPLTRAIRGTGRVVLSGLAFVAPGLPMSALSSGITAGSAISMYEFIDSTLSHQTNAAPVEVVVDASGQALVDSRLDTIDTIADSLFQGDTEVSPQAVIAASNNAQPSKPGQANLETAVAQSKPIAGGPSSVITTATTNAITAAYARSTPVTTNGFIPTSQRRAAIVEITDGNDPGTVASIETTELQNGGDVPISIINVSKTNADSANLIAITKETQGVYKQANPGNAANVAAEVRHIVRPHGESKQNTPDWTWLLVSIDLAAVEAGYLTARKKFAYRRGVEG